MRRLWRAIRPAWVVEPVPVAAAFAAAAVTLLALVIFVYLVPTVHSDSGRLGGGIRQAAPCRAAVKRVGLKQGLKEPECVQQATYIIRTCVIHPPCLRPLLKGLLVGLKRNIVVIPKGLEPGSALPYVPPGAG